MKGPLYSLVIPLYNEEKQASLVIKKILDYFSDDLELILVNNGSRDNTERIIDSFRGRARKVSFSDNQGYGGGIISGLRKARGEFIGFTTGGGQVMPESILKVFEEARKNPNSVCKAKRMQRESLFRRFTSYGYNFLANAIFFVRLTDINGHPVVLEKKVFDELGLQTKDFMINIELYIKAKKRGMRIIQVRIPYYKRMGGSRSHVTLLTVVQMFRELIAFRRKLSMYMEGSR